MIRPERIGHVVIDNPPEEIAKFPNSYLGMDKLAFAQDAPGLADVIAQLGIGNS